MSKDVNCWSCYKSHIKISTNPFLIFQVVMALFLIKSNNFEVHFLKQTNHNTNQNLEVLSVVNIYIKPMVDRSILIFGDSKTFEDVDILVVRGTKPPSTSHKTSMFSLASFFSCVLFTKRTLFIPIVTVYLFDVMFYDLDDFRSPPRSRL